MGDTPERSGTCANTGSAPAASVVDLPHGEYVLWGTAGGRSSAPARITLAGSEAQEVELRLAPAAGLELRWTGEAATVAVELFDESQPAQGGPVRRWRAARNRSSRLTIYPGSFRLRVLELDGAELGSRQFSVASGERRVVSLP